MSMELTKPFAILLLGALPFVIWLGRPTGLHRKVRGWSAVLLRCVIVLLVVLSLAGMRRVSAADEMGVVFLVDVSDSMGEAGRKEAMDFVRASLEAMPPGDKAALVLFGSDALVERPLSPDKSLGELASVPNTSYTNIASAIRVGMAMLPSDIQRRIVLVSDGAANVEDAGTVARLAHAAGVELVSVPIDPSSENDVRLDSVEAPSTLYPDERFDLTVNLHSTYDAPVTLQVFAEGSLVAEQDVSLMEGVNSFVLPLQAGEAGFTTFYARVVPRGEDAFPENNELSSFGVVKGAPSILLISKSFEEVAALAEVLSEIGFNVVGGAPQDMPSEPAGMNQYRSIVMVNIPSHAFSPRQLKSLKSYVRDLGGGLVVVGGDESYAAGGYYQTPLEEILPVDMVIKDKTRLPSLTMVMVIDKSGSMADSGSVGGGPRKVELAKESIIRSLDLLAPWDKVGVVAFDDSSHWVIRPTLASDTGVIRDAVGTIRAGGGTDIYAGLKAAADVIVEDEAELRHIILLTDGGADPSMLPELVDSLYEQEVTLSVVAIGEGYAPFLKDLAEAGGGRFYFARDANVIPQVFAQEAVLSTRAYIQELDFTPRLAGVSPIVGNIESVPQLHGYVATSPKATANVVLVAEPETDPILAHWQYGLGRSVAWTSDASSRWASDWVAWDGFSSFWARVVRWSIVEGSGSGLEMQTRLEGNRALLAVEAVDEAGDFRNDLDMAVSVVTPSLDRQDVKLRQVAPGRYEGEFTPPEIGTYLLHAVGTANGEVAAADTTGFVMSYSPEYRNYGMDLALLSGVAELGGGGIVDNPEDVFAHTLPPVRRSMELWPWLMAIAAVLLPLDVGVRRVVVTRKDLAEFWRRVSGRLAAAFPGEKRPHAVETPSGMEQLLATKSRVESGRKVYEGAVLPVEEAKKAVPSEPVVVIKPAPDSPKAREVEEESPPQEEGDTVSRLLQKKKKRKDGK